MGLNFHKFLNDILFNGTGKPISVMKVVLSFAECRPVKELKDIKKFAYANCFCIFRILTLDHCICRQTR